MSKIRFATIAVMLGFTLLFLGCAEQAVVPTANPAVAEKTDSLSFDMPSGGGDGAAPIASPTRSPDPTSSAGATKNSSTRLAAKESPAESTTGPAEGGLVESSDKASSDESIRPPREESESRRQMQAGLLTAGSFDDHQRYGHFQEFLSKSQQNDPSETLPRMAIGRRAIIHVHNGQGEPISAARVVVSSKQSQQVLLDTKTGSDGRTLFLTGIDHQGASSLEYDVTVTPPNSASITQTMNTETELWRIESQDAQTARPQKLDLALVIDATGSMGDELNYLKIEIDHIATTVKRMFPNVDQRYSLIVYRDAGDTYVTRVFDFTNSLSTFRSTLSKQSASGGGDYPEAMHLAMENAGQLNWRGGNTSRVMFLIGDAPPHDEDAGRTLAAAKTLRQKNVRVFPIAASGAAWKAEYVLRSMAFLTMGQYLFLTDHSGVGNPHAAPHVPDYQVEHLNRLMVRMVAQELAGKKLAPQEVIAIERGDASPLQFQPLQPLAQQVGANVIQPVNQQMICGVTAPVRRDVYFFSLSDLPIDRLTFKWMVYGVAICGIIALGCVASRL